MDGIDVALIKTDGFYILEEGPFLTIPYEDSFRDSLKATIDGKQEIASTEKMLTLKHAHAVAKLLKMSNVSEPDIDIIGFHGHTISHKPKEKHTLQIGDGSLLARTTNIDVVNDFRSADITAGGQGAPLAPIFHKALIDKSQLPAIILNIGGVANITWIGVEDNELLGFDTGPGNALLNDWIAKHTNAPYDIDGQIAAKGNVHRGILSKLLSHKYFSTPPPKSLDRDDFKIFSNQFLSELSTEDGAATLSAFTVQSIGKAIQSICKPCKTCVVVGGGRHNRTIMKGLKENILSRVITGDNFGWSGDAVEAQAFAFLAVRSRLNLPISFPGTTGISHPISGGVFYSKH